MPPVTRSQGLPLAGVQDEARSSSRIKRRATSCGSAMEEGSGGGGGDFDRLPEACISHVMSLASPPDACRWAAVSAAFRSAVDSDTVWERFLPPDYRRILERADDPIRFSSKRELYFRLCDPILIDGGNMSFQLEKSSGAKCYMISARGLSIAWGDNPLYWKWISASDTSLNARFAEAAHLLNVCWLEIHGKIESRMLSPKTKYAAYLIFKLDSASRGLCAPVQEASVKVGAHESRHTVCLQHEDDVQYPADAYGLFLRMFNSLPRSKGKGSGSVGVPCTRGDGWMEVEMGEFFNDNGDDGEVDACFMEVNGGVWKSGLTVLGIELRPKK